MAKLGYLQNKPNQRASPGASAIAAGRVLQRASYPFASNIMEPINWCSTSEIGTLRIPRKPLEDTQTPEMRALHRLDPLI